MTLFSSFESPPRHSCVDPFFIFLGEGGGKTKNNIKIFRASARKFMRQKIENCLCLVLFDIKYGFVVNYSAHSTYSCIRYYEFFNIILLLQK